MLEKELQFERGLFFSLNGSDSAFWDNFFYIYTNPLTWLIFYLCFLWVFTYKKNWKETVCILVAIGLLFLLCDQISSSVFKPYFHRFRPTHHSDFMDHVKILFNYRGENCVFISGQAIYLDKKGVEELIRQLYGGRYGFISGHAANMFGFATFCALVFRNRLFTFTIFLFVLLIAYSRVYLGVHFISDVVVGAIVGSLIAVFVYWLYGWLRSRWLRIESEQLEKPLCSRQETYFLCGVFYLYIIIILLFNTQLVGLLLPHH